MSKPVFDKVDEALELQVIDWLQWYEFTQNDEVRLAALALELISKRKAAFAKLEAENEWLKKDCEPCKINTKLEASNKILREALKFIKDVPGMAGMDFTSEKKYSRHVIVTITKHAELALSQANQEGEL